MLSQANPYDNTSWFQHTVAVSQPAAGAEAQLTLIQNRLQQLQDVSFTLATDGNAGIRRISLELVQTNPYTQNIELAVASPPQAQSTTISYHFCSNPQVRDSADNVLIICPLLTDFRFVTNDNQLWIRVDNIKAGDQLSDIYLLSKHWPWYETP